jgi:hypothetical protein
LAFSGLTRDDKSMAMAEKARRLKQMQGRGGSE